MSTSKLGYINPSDGPFREPSAEEVRETVNAVCDRINLVHPTELHVERAAPVARRTGRTEHYSQYTRFIKWCAGRTEKVGNFLIDRTRFTALRLTALATTLAAVTSALALLNQYMWAAGVLVVAGLFEAVDAVAARRSAHDRRDVFVDYVSDRIADIFLFGALTISMIDANRTAAALAAGVLLLSLLSSYTRAEAEAMRFRSRSRFGRLERLVATIVLFIGIGLLGGTSSAAAQTFAIWTLSLVAVLTLVTLAERLLCVIRSVDYLTLEVAAEWDDENGLPRLLRNALEVNDRLTVYETTDEREEIGQLFHIHKSRSGATMVSLESGVTQKSLRRRMRAG